MNKNFQYSNTSLQSSTTPILIKKRFLYNQRKISNDVLNEFKMLTNSWTCFPAILSTSNSIYTKNFALTVLEYAIQTQWNIFSKENRGLVRNHLVNYLINAVTKGIEDKLVNKLNILIVEIAKREWTSDWSEFLNEICNSSKNDANLCQNNLKILQMLK